MAIREVSARSADVQEAIRRWREQGPKHSRNSVILAFAIVVALLIAFFALSKASAFQSPDMGRDRGMGREGRGFAQTPEQRLENLSKQLNLTDDQKAKIKPILEGEAKQIQSLREDSSLSREDRRAKSMQIRQSTHTQIRTLLTADQQKKFDSMQQRGGRWQRQGTQPPASETP
jgi:protein CpxP